MTRRDTHLPLPGTHTSSHYPVTSDLWRIIGPTCSAVRHGYDTDPCLSALWDNAFEGGGSSSLRRVKEECECVASPLLKQKLIHVNHGFGLFAINDETGEGWGDVKSSSLTARLCHPSPPSPSIHPSIPHNEHSSRPPSAAQKLESWLWIYMSV